MAEILSIVAVVVAGLSLLNSWWQGRRSNAIAERANEIAEGSLAFTRARATSEEAIFVQPIRWDSGSNRVVFEVTAAGPVPEVEFEFINYASAGGQFSRTMVQPGEIAIPHGEFTHEKGTLAVPEGPGFAATARWRRRPGDAWSTCGLYLASKGRYSFRQAPTETPG